MPRREEQEEDAPPLMPSYPPPLSPGMRRATGRAASERDTYYADPASEGESKKMRTGPLRAGRWMLKRSEHLRRWNKRWVALDDAKGESVEIRSDPTDDKPRAGISLGDVRCVFPFPAATFAKNNHPKNKQRRLFLKSPTKRTTRARGVAHPTPKSLYPRRCPESDDDAGRWSSLNPPPPLNSLCFKHPFFFPSQKTKNNQTTEAPRCHP